MDLCKLNPLYIAGVNYESFSDGEGCRCTIFISGCLHECKGCHNKDAWNFEYGIPATPSLADEINKEIAKRPFLSGLTISGGDPMWQINKVLDFVEKINVPKNNIWLYTGFVYEDMHGFTPKRFYEKINVVVDGKYVEDLRDVSLKFKGSSNQRTIDVFETEKQKKIVLYN